MNKIDKEFLNKAIPTVVAIIGIVVIERQALIVGINGKMLALCYGIIGGLGGYTFKEIKDKVVKN